MGEKYIKAYKNTPKEFIKCKPEAKPEKKPESNTDKEKLLLEIDLI